MTSERDWDAEMRGRAIDDDTADRLLSGRVAPDDAPPGYAGLAAIIQVATAPASATELSGEAAVVAAVRSSLASMPAPPRRKPMLAKVLTAKFAAAAAVAALGAGTAAAAMTGNLPVHPSHSSDVASADTTTTAPSPSSTTVPTTSTTEDAPSTTAPAAPTTTAPSSPTSSSAVGPVNGMANGNATFGLCTAFLHGSSNKDNSVAFQDLIAANGGSAAATTTFCQGYVTANHPGMANGHSTSGSSTSTGQPSSPGNSSGHAPVNPGSGHGNSGNGHGGSH